MVWHCKCDRLFKLDPSRRAAGKTCLEGCWYRIKCLGSV